MYVPQEIHLVETMLFSDTVQFWNRQRGRDRIGAINILPPPRAVVELDNATNAPPTRATTGKSTDDSASSEQVI